MAVSCNGRNDFSLYVLLYFLNFQSLNISSQKNLNVLKILQNKGSLNISMCTTLDGPFVFKF